MYDFSFSLPENIIVGAGSLKKLGETAEKLGGKKGLVISGPHLNKIGVVDSCIEYLKQAGIAADRFTEVEANPSVDTVEKAAEKFKNSGADFIVAIGGGSPMDVAKAVGVVASYGGSITDYEGAGKVPGKIVPQIAIPTTAGPGSEVTAFSVITDHSRNYKLTVFSYELLPEYAILDAELITTVPAHTAAACGMDAFIHACEAYISTAANPFSEAMSEKAMELIGGNIRKYVARRSDTAAAENMLLGSLFAGIAFSYARLGNVHAMSHPVSAYFDVPHGVANAILLPAVLEYNALADAGKYEKIYRYINPEAGFSGSLKSKFTPGMLVDAIRDLNKALGIPKSLSEVGVDAEKIENMADDALKSGNIQVNPRSTGKQDIIELYKKSM
jgi:alcohol dehydrogenase